MKCHEYFDCQKKKCPALTDDSRPCWERDDTLCNNPCLGMITDNEQDNPAAFKAMVCKLCIYFKYTNPKA